MKAPFRKLDYEEQYRILTTAMEEFSEHGYRRASTNRIVSAAAMSKGMLYYYFASKEALYISAAEFAYDHFTEHLVSNFTIEPEGFIERMSRLSRNKYRYFTRHPEISKFVTHMFYSDELLESYQFELEKLRNKNLSILYDDVDMERFRDDIDHRAAMKMIQWTVDGYIREMEQHFEAEGVDFSGIDHYFDQFEGYLEAMRKIYYKGASQ